MGKTLQSVVPVHPISLLRTHLLHPYLNPEPFSSPNSLETRSTPRFARRTKMTTLEIIESTFKALHKRTDDAFENVELIGKQHAKTTSGMNNVVDTIREMREKVRSLMSLQDDIAHQFKNVDKIVMGNAAADYNIEPVKRVKKEAPKSFEDDLDDYKPASKVTFDEDEYKPTPRKEPVFDELSDDEPAPKEEEPAAAEPAAEEPAAEEAAAEEPAAEEAAPEEAAPEEAAPEVDEEAEARRIAELELQQLAEEEARLAAEEEERIKAEEEELKRLEEEEKLRAEEEELKRLQEEEEALRAEEEELKKLEEEEAKAAEEEAAKKAAEEEAKKKPAPGKPGPGKGKFQFGNQLKGGAGGKNKVVFK